MSEVHLHVCGQGECGVTGASRSLDPMSGSLASPPVIVSVVVNQRHHIAPQMLLPSWQSQDRHESGSAFHEGCRC